MSENINRSASFEHWKRSMARTFAELPLVFETTSRGRLSTVGGWFSETLAPAVNDNEREIWR
jgi:hypothetical protein